MYIDRQKDGGCIGATIQYCKKVLRRDQRSQKRRWLCSVFINIRCTSYWNRNSNSDFASGPVRRDGLYPAVRQALQAR